MTAPAAPPASRRVERREVAVEGVRFVIDRAEPAGKSRATPALLLHGVPQTRAVWHALVDDLARDRVVVAPDLKGLGESEIRGPYDVPTLVHELAALALHEVDGRVDVVGHDWGGTLALALAGARPDLVRRLVVVNAPFRKIDLTRAWHIPLFALPVLPELVFAVTGERLVSTMLDHAWRGATPLEPARRAAYVAAYSDSRRVGAMLGYYRAAFRGRITGPVRAALGRGAEPLGLPRPEAALVVWGAADPVLPISIGESVVRDLGPDTEFVTLPGIGHFAVDEATETVTETIAAFLRADDPGAT